MTEGYFHALTASVRGLEKEWTLDETCMMSGASLNQHSHYFSFIKRSGHIRISFRKQNCEAGIISGLDFPGVEHACQSDVYVGFVCSLFLLLLLSMLLLR